MPTKKEAAKKIASEVFKRRRELQYAAMIDWKNGKITGVQCLDEIERLQTLILLKPEDFRPLPPAPKKETKDSV